MPERTLSIIKPDGTKRHLIGRIIARFEENGLQPVAMQMLRLSRPRAEGFYAIHRARPFFNDLVSFMISGPVVVMVLEGEDAVHRNRTVMGATNPKDAAPGTIRRDFSQSVTENTVHGSDSPETARTEIAFFFPTLEETAR